MEIKRQYAGRWLLFWGALIMFVTVGYELYGRADTLIWAIKGVYNLCLNEGIPFARAWTYFEPGMFELVGFLAACVLLGLLGVILCNRARAGYFLLAAIAALVYWGMAGLGLFDLFNVFQIHNIQLIPMALMAVGCVFNLMHFYHMRRMRARKVARREQQRAARRASHDESQGADLPMAQ